MKSLALLSIAALALSAQQPQIENAQVTKRASSGALAAQFTQLGSGPFWVGYSEPIAPNRHNTMCGSNQSTDAPLRLEGQTAIVILARFTAGQMDELRITSPDCRLDAGGLPFFWFDNVPATESIAWLKTKVSPTKPDSAIMAISMHTGPAADAALRDVRPFVVVARRGEDHVLPNVRLHLPDVARVRLDDVDDEELGTVLVLLIHFGERGSLPAKGRSSVAAENEDDWTAAAE